MRRRTLVLLGSIALVGVGLLLALWLLRGVIATSIARDQLASRGLSCDERFGVSLDATLSRATIGPTRCTREGGVLEAIELLGDVTVELDGVTPRALRAGSLRIVLRSADVRGGSSWAEALRRLSLEPQVAALVKGLSELSGMDLPSSTLAEVEVVRGGRQLAWARGLGLEPGAELSLRVRSLRFSAGPMGVGQLELTGVSGGATRSRVTLRGRATVRAGVGILSVSAGGPFTLEASGLDTASPRFRLDGDF